MNYELPETKDEIIRRLEKAILIKDDFISTLQRQLKKADNKCNLLTQRNKTLSSFASLKKGKRLVKSRKPLVKRAILSSGESTGLKCARKKKES